MNGNKQTADNQQVKESLSATPQAKGERIKRIRHLANLSREDLCADSDINLATLISWEVGRFGGLSQKGAMRLIARVAKEGVFCTAEWLLYEIGTSPKVIVDYKKIQQVDTCEHVSIVASNITESEVIIEELMLFRKLNINTVDYIIDDDAMLPFYNPGDYVGGTRRSSEKLKELIGLDCIIQTKDGRMLVRKLQAGPGNNKYNLVGINLQAKCIEAIIYNVEIQAASPIIWHRRKEPSSL